VRLADCYGGAELLRALSGIVIFAAWTTAAHAAEFIGSVSKVVDGDTLWVCDAAACTKIRICGIDTPEKGQGGYLEAKAALETITKNKTVRCVQVGGGTPCDGRSEPINRDRIVAQCFTETGDIAEPLVSGGYACDWVKFSGGHYSKAGRRKPCSR
jgi:endonuclease YncB( thermonuclease family)